MSEPITPLISPGNAPEEATMINSIGPSYSTPRTIKSMEEKNLPDRADERLTEWLNKDPLIPAAISTIPVFGGPLATFYSGKWHQIHEQRTNALLQQFREHVSSLDQQALRKDFFDTPEGIDLLIRADEQSSKTRSDGKRDLIARILRGAVIDYEQGTYSPEEYLNLLSDLTVQELRVARLLYEERPEISEEPWSEWEERACTEIGVDKSDLHMALSRLSTTGLLQQVVARDTDEGDLWLSTPEYGEGGYFRVTRTFDKLMTFLDLTT